MNTSETMSKQEILDIASKYEYKSIFKSKEPVAYRIAQINGWIDEVCVNMKWKIVWTKQLVLEVAKTFEYKKDFMNYAKGAYDYASKHGFIAEATANLKSSSYNSVAWDDDSAIKEAAKNEYLSVFKRRTPSAYHYLRKRGLLVSATKHMSKKFVMDVVYMWNSVENPSVWKIGASTQKYHKRRLARVLNRSKLSIDRSVKVVTDDARKLEKLLLKFGNPFYTETKFNGSTEFRILDDVELETCLHLMSEYGEVVNG